MGQPGDITCSVIFGRSGNEFTPIQESLAWSTAAVGGYANASFSVGGDQRRKFPYLGLVRIMLGPRRLWEGQIEDTELVVADGDIHTAVTCFGLQRLLAENTVRAIYSKRDMSWQETPLGDGANVIPGAGTITKRSTGVSIATGQFDPTDPTRSGVRFNGNGVALATSEGDSVDLTGFPLGLTLISLLFDVTLAGANVGPPPNKVQGFIASSSDGTAWTGSGAITASATGQSLALAAAANRIRLAWVSAGATTPTSADSIAFENMRLLGTSLTEDAAGGFYGGTLLRQLVGLCSGLTVGLIESGSDFTIQAIERSVRDTVLSAVQEVAGYYTREWAVWDDGRFDWVTKQLDQPQWIVRTNQMASMNMKGTLDLIGKQIIVLYTDAASGLDAEATAAATAQRNPYVKQNRAKDILVKPSFPMTSNTSQQLATTLVADAGAWVPVTGTVVLPASTIVAHASGQQVPAYAIRAGDNLRIPDLPKTEMLASGRDGETLFHIVSSDVSLDEGTVTLELEGQTRKADVLLAQLAAVSRTITG